MRGRKPKLEVVTGGKMDVVPEPPEHFNEAARETWDAHVSDMIKSGLFSAGQRDLFINYCVLSALIKRMEGDLAGTGTFYLNKNGEPKPHPLVRQIREAMDTLRRQSEALGLTQIARHRAGAGDQGGQGGDNGAPPDLDL